MVLAFARRMVEDTDIVELSLLRAVQTGTSRVVCLERQSRSFYQTVSRGPSRTFFHFSENCWKMVGYYFYDVLRTKRT